MNGNEYTKYADCSGRTHNFVFKAFCYAGQLAEV